MLGERRTSKDLAKLGSETAKGGFRNERRIATEFNNYNESSLAQRWLRKMGYKIDCIKRINANCPRKSSQKADIILEITNIDETIDIHKISCKKGSGNQVNKRPVNRYKELWNLSEITVKALKKFVGENKYMPVELLKRGEITVEKYKKRMIFKELEPYEQKAILKEFTEKKDLILKFIIQGIGDMSADWWMRDNDLDSIQSILSVAGTGGVVPTRTGFKIGVIKVQRKGGTPDPQSLQFKW